MSLTTYLKRLFEPFRLHDLHGMKTAVSPVVLDDDICPTKRRKNMIDMGFIRLHFYYFL